MIDKYIINDDDELTDSDIKSMLKACYDASKRMLKNGHPIVYTKGNKLVREYPDGTIEFIKDVPPNIKVEDWEKPRHRKLKDEKQINET